MTRKIKLTKTAQLRLDQLLGYLEEEWSEKVKQDFIEKLDKRVEHVRIRPSLFPKSLIKEGLHKCVVSKQTTFYYTYSQTEITILTVFDTRQDPNKLERQMKPNKT
jgi:plasmid stabilization system protein ParE